MYNIRYAQPSDIENIFSLSNDKTVRLNSINKEFIDWQDHVQWFNKKIKSENTIFYIMEYNICFAGYCRLDKDKGNEWIVTIHLEPDYRNKGLGAILLQEVCSKNSDKNIIAYIKYTNDTSYKLFQKSNFRVCEYVYFSDDKYYKMELLR